MQKNSFGFQLSGVTVAYKLEWQRRGLLGDFQLDYVTGILLPSSLFPFGKLDRTVRNQKGSLQVTVNKTERTAVEK
ncbi:hypothetical protein J6590_075170 [Homalodisca vitripennis]|nr:hypothetical protein J6590_075170 [Homalodisca vitripennis]